MNIKIIASIILASALLLSAKDGIIKKGNVLYLPNKLIVKFKADSEKTFYKNSMIPTASAKTLENIGAVEVMQSIIPAKEEAVNYNDIKNTYIVEYNSPYDPQILSAKLNKSKDVEWAEPWYVYEISFEPDDPKFADGTQWYLNKISAPQAWDLSRGSADIVIAINDTGVDWDHPDLAANVWTNPGEIPNNGIDDDNNGYVDDVRGWDFGGTDGTQDNDPMEDSPTHGTYVAGFASAVTNNSEGIAAIGFNCTIMPVKTSQQSIGNGIIAYGREGIIYAAENGADVINCSWGGSPYSQALQEAITYATSLGALVVSSSDNDNKIEPAYPSAYKGVLSVGGTNPDDERYSAGNYGPTVDVVAPATGITGGSGLGMYGTFQNDTYIQGSSGTSLASPIAAGLAGLVIDRFPNYTPLQVAEQIRVNSDYIDDKNPGFEYYLGSGRINAVRALNNTNSISLRVEDFAYTDLSNGNGVTEPGENFSLGMNFKNYLNPASNVTVTLESRSEFVTITQNSYTISSVGTLQETSNFSSPFEFSIANNIPENEDVELLIKFDNGGGYQDFQLFIEKFNTTYLTQAGNDLALTITSKGNLGYNDYGQQPTEGDGLFFENGSNLLFEGALIYGNAEDRIMDAAHEDYLSNLSEDFEPLIPFSLSIPGSISDYQGFTKFNDNKADPKLGIETELHTYSFSQDEYSKFILLRYMFHNTSDSTINNFFAGLFFDLDMHDFDDDHTSWDDTDKFGYVYDDGGRIEDHIGVALVSDQNYGYRAMSNSGNNPIGGVSLNPRFNDDGKWLAIASRTTIRDYGPGDIAFSVSGGPYQIEPGKYLNVVFSIAGGYSVEELRTAIQSSRLAAGLIPTSVEKLEDELPIKFSLSQNYPNPFNPSTKIKFNIPTVETGHTPSLQTSLIVYDVLGREVKTLINQNMQPGKYEVEFNATGLSSGVYFYKLSAGSFAETKKMMLVR